VGSRNVFILSSVIAYKQQTIKMSKSSTLTDRFALLVIIAAVLSCDSITDPDTVTPEKFTQSDYYILPGTSAIIDLESVLDQSFLNGTLSISENPKRGTLSYVTTSLLKYKPGREFQEGEDHFILSVLRDGKIVAKGAMTIKMKNSAAEFSCDLVLVEDKIKLKAGSSSVSTRIFENDWFCNIDKSNVSISIESQPKFGQALIDYESIIYIPAAEYEDRDELIYKVTGPTGEIVSYGLLSFHDYGEITIQKIPNKGPVTSLFFLDENTGFLGTRWGLYKTTDGGNNWDVLVPDLYYNSVFFLDERNGFALHSLDIPIFRDGLNPTFDGPRYPVVYASDGTYSDIFISTGILTITTDGGATWKELPPLFEQSLQLSRPVTSIVFTSETTGFLVVKGQTGLLKTEDGGMTWKDVSLGSTLPGYGYYDIQFINHTTGYAAVSDWTSVTNDADETWTSLFVQQIFVTKDAGESWTELFGHSSDHVQWIDYFQVTEENKLFAVLSDDKTSIITSQDGSEWRPVANFSSSILSIGFSPSAEIGFALVGDGAASQNNNTDLNLHPISIVKTIDKGETWIEEPMDEELQGFPLSMSIPSNDVAYFLCYDRIIKYSNK
jgi:photosystem II stability/assembly factor-like uncharacterized protein